LTQFSVGTRKKTTMPWLQAPIIFLVDEDPDQLHFLASFLNQLGFSTAEARDGQEALELLSHSLVLLSLVLIELNLPRMDGWEFLARKRKDSELVAIPLVIITGDRARAPKNVPALSKPINLRHLALAAKFYCGTAM
jgi:CheY-like chemotaxis protein